MKTTAEYPVVLITGALAGIGRATAIAFGREGAGSSSRAAVKSRASPWKPNCINSERKRPSFTLTFAKKML
jgi:NAD(P)-dependent dehydrogenase (short-subunit alcohol dehydrogenase family)